MHKNAKSVQSFLIRFPFVLSNMCFKQNGIKILAFYYIRISFLFILKACIYKNVLSECSLV